MLVLSPEYGKSPVAGYFCLRGSASPMVCQGWRQGGGVSVCVRRYGDLSENSPAPKNENPPGVLEGVEGLVLEVLPVGEPTEGPAKCNSDVA